MIDSRILQGDTLATELSAPITDRRLPVSARIPEPATARPRLVVVSCDAEMAQLLQDIMEAYDVTGLPHPVSMTAIDAEDPDVLLVGTSEGGLTPDQIVALAAAHMRLRQVPILVMSAEPDLLEDARRMSRFPGVRLVSLPFDLETISSVLHSVVRPARPRSSARLPETCRHGFYVVGEHCRRCG
jgi:hypothetical protein